MATPKIRTLLKNNNDRTPTKAMMAMASGMITLEDTTKATATTSSTITRTRVSTARSTIQTSLVMTTISFIQEAIPSKHLKDVAVIRLQEMGKCDLPQIQEPENYPMLMAIIQTSKCKTDTHSFQIRCKVMDMDDLRQSNRG